ncbi:MAG TPA: zf-HC2 domain-containing protein [Actinomycetota bacterium]|nr:zf-HC2 domain-containing protein [Actinomycetota bacterium]
MTTHPEHEQLSAYADGELGATERVAVEAHLAACGKAREMLAAIRATLADFAALDEVEMDPQVGFAIRSALARERKLSSRTRRYAWAGGAAAAALVGILSFAILGGGPNPARDASGAGLGGGPQLMAMEDLDEDSALRVLETYVQENYAFPGARGDMGGDDAAAETAVLTHAPPAPEIQAYSAADATTFADCIRTIERESDSARLVRSIAATYKGEPVYVLIFEIPAERPDRVEMWITARDSCETRYFSQANVNR